MEDLTLEQRVEQLERGQAAMMLNQATMIETVERIDKNTVEIVSMFQAARAAGTFFGILGKFIGWLAKLGIAAGALYAGYHAAYHGDWVHFLK